MKLPIALLLVSVTRILAADAIRMEAIGWIKDSENLSSREVGLSTLSIQLTVFNDSQGSITLPSLILSNVAISNSQRSPELLLTYTPWKLMSATRKQYPIIPSKEAFFPVEIRPGESAHVKMEETASWLNDAGRNPRAVVFRTTGFLAERLGFTLVDLQSPLQIVDQREPVRPVKVAPTADRGWLKVDEGFQFLIPSDWKDREARGIDSHVGHYAGPRAYLEFDELLGLGRTKEETQKVVAELMKKETDPKLLRAGEVVWRLDGQIALFTSAKVDVKVFGNREFPNVASLFVPYEGQAGYLSVHLFYADDDYLATATQILRSFTWPKLAPARGKK